MRILYGVTGEGLGHTMRAGVLIDHLFARGHRVQIAASGRAATQLAREHAELVSIAGLSISYSDGGVERLRTIGRNVRAVPAALQRNTAAAAKVVCFDPEVVVTDFDSFSYAMGRLLDRPTITDHVGRVVAAERRAA